MIQEIVCCLLRTFRGKWLLCVLCKSKEFCEKEFTTYTIAHLKGRVPAVPLVQQEEEMSQRRWCLRATSIDVIWRKSGWAFLNLVCVVWVFFFFLVGYLFFPGGLFWCDLDNVLSWPMLHLNRLSDITPCQSISRAFHMNIWHCWAAFLVLFFFKRKGSITTLWEE